MLQSTEQVVQNTFAQGKGRDAQVGDLQIFDQYIDQDGPRYDLPHAFLVDAWHIRRNIPDRDRDGLFDFSPEISPLRTSEGLDGHHQALI